MRIGKPSDIAVDPFDGEWVDGYLLAGRDGDVWLRRREPVTVGALRALVAARAADLREVGLRPGGAVGLRQPPGLEYVVNLLAAWRVGAQVSLLDHRLTAHEVSQALARIGPQFVIADGGTIAAYPGEPARTHHALLQLSSGSTGPSKVVGRTASALVTEVETYRLIDGTPQPGERIVLLASMVHVLGLVGGLLYGLRTGVQIVLPGALTTDAILTAVAGDPAPATVLGVPTHLPFLTAGSARRLPQLKRATVGGELVRPAAWQAFTDRYGVPLGNMYGMTEVGVIATDLFGEHRPALRPIPGMAVREEAGQLLVATAESPYVGLTDPGRWVDGWLYTKDAGAVDAATGLVTVRGRLDSQVSVGGLKVDLSEVEQVLTGLPGVVEAVVAWDGAIEAFVALEDPAGVPALKEALAGRLAAYKRPRRLTVVTRLPRTSSGKLIRAVGALRAAVFS